MRDRKVFLQYCKTSTQSKLEPFYKNTDMCYLSCFLADRTNGRSRLCYSVAFCVRRRRRRLSVTSCIVAKRCVLEQKLLLTAYRKLPSLFLMVSSLTPYDLSFPQNEGSICPQHTRMAISLQRVIRSTSCLVLGSGFRGQRIERRYLRFEQIKDGGRRHLG